MQNKVVVFTEQEIGDLNVFLSRTSLTGAEVPAYVAIINKLAIAQVVKKMEPKTTTTDKKEDVE